MLKNPVHLQYVSRLIELLKQATEKALRLELETRNTEMQSDRETSKVIMRHAC